MEKNRIEREIPGGCLRLRAAGEGENPNKIEGLAVVFNSESVPLYSDEKIEIREIISPDAITPGLIAKSDILATLYHDDTRILARSMRGAGSLSLDKSESGLEFSFEAPDTEDGRTALELVKRGDINGCSFKYMIDMSDPEAQKKTEEKRDGKRIITYTVKRIHSLLDVTLTPHPAYPDTYVKARMRDVESAESTAEPIKPDNSTDLAYVETLIKR
ncbi:MAG: HK97 family phage prohead protease [Candidatus Amulumruptor caecigallinarius]|nr:HK97 family phage prohead protease [Candidatus Amulumruptor caecigallinarius]